MKKVTHLFLILTVIFAGGCKDKQDEINIPVIATTDASNVSTTGAMLGGNVVNDGGSAITQQGVCWSIDPMPTVSDNITSDSIGIGIFTSALSGLTPNTTYYVRAYATNSKGTGYGHVISFTTFTTDNPHLLFKSGFEENVNLIPISGRKGSQSQYLTGSDVAPFDWGTTKPMGAIFKVQVLASVNDLPLDINNYISNSIEQVTGPTGSTTRVLKLSQPLFSDPIEQNSLQQMGVFHTTDIYIRYWMKLDSGFLSRVSAAAAEGRQTWHNLLETKHYLTENGTLLCYRVQNFIKWNKNLGKLYFSIDADRQVSGQAGTAYWGKDATPDEMPVPIGQWFHYEVYFHLSTGNDGIFEVAVNGKVLRHDGPSFGGKPYPPSNIYYALLYNYNVDCGWDLYIDDFEVWDTPPCGTLPCK